MKVLLCHTYYQQRGGEDRSFEEERELLTAGGHEVIEFVRSNDELQSHSALRAAGVTIWNRQAAREIKQLIQQHRPEVVHLTNTFPLLSPAVLRAAHGQGAAVVQALRNYRLLCANACLVRAGSPCEKCLGRTIPWPAVVHGCYRDSAAASGVVASMQVLHRLLGTWRNKVDAYFTLTEFARQKFIDGGYPAERIHVKHNSVYPDPGPRPSEADYLVLVGRLSQEKGIATVLEAWAANPSLPPLRIAGDGPLAELVRNAQQQDRRIEWLGHLDREQLYDLIGNARALLMPSIWYETFGRTIAEAFAVGTPVIASRLGAMAELVRDEQTGLLFEPGNPADLAQKITHFQGLSNDAVSKMSRTAREAYDGHFTAEQNYQRLLEIYQLAQQQVSQQP